MRLHSLPGPYPGSAAKRAGLLPAAVVLRWHHAPTVRIRGSIRLALAARREAALPKTPAHRISAVGTRRAILKRGVASADVELGGGDAGEVGWGTQRAGDDVVAGRQFRDGVAGL